MKQGFTACLVAVSAMLFSFGVADAQPHPEGETEAAYASEQKPQEVLVTPDAQSHPDAPVPFDGSMVFQQGLASLGVGLGTFLGGTIGLAISAFGSSDEFMWMGAAVMGTFPFTAGWFVNDLGSNRGFPAQHIGAYVGGLIPAAATAPIWIIGLQRGSDRMLLSGLLGYFTMTVAGSVIGFHTQATSRLRPAGGSKTSRRVTIVPVADSVSADAGPGLIWSGRF